jgi:hypothetical protein
LIKIWHVIVQAFSQGHSIKEIDRVLDRLREFWRTSYNSERELAHRMGVAHSSLIEWLRGKRRPKSLDLIESLLAK